MNNEIYIARDEDGTLSAFYKCPLRQEPMSDEVYDEILIPDFLRKKGRWWGTPPTIYSCPNFNDISSSAMKLPKEWFPEITWEDEPRLVRLTAVSTHKCSYCGKEFTYSDDEIIDKSEPERELFWLQVICPYCQSENTI